MFFGCMFFEIWLNRNFNERCNSDKQLTWLNEPCCEVRNDIGEMARLSLTIGNFCHPKPGHQFFKSQMECVGWFFPGAISCGQYQSIMLLFEARTNEITKILVVIVWGHPKGIEKGKNFLLYIYCYCPQNNMESTCRKVNTLRF